MMKSAIKFALIVVSTFLLHPCIPGYLWDLELGLLHILALHHHLFGFHCLEVLLDLHNEYRNATSQGNVGKLYK